MAKINYILEGKYKDAKLLGGSGDVYISGRGGSGTTMTKKMYLLTSL